MNEERFEAIVALFVDAFKTYVTLDEAYEMADREYINGNERAVIRARILALMNNCIFVWSHVHYFDLEQRAAARKGSVWVWRSAQAARFSREGTDSGVLRVLLRNTAFDSYVWRKAVVGYDEGFGTDFARTCV